MHLNLHEIKPNSPDNEVVGTRDLGKAADRSENQSTETAFGISSPSIRLRPSKSTQPSPQNDRLMKLSERIFWPFSSCDGGFRLNETAIQIELRRSNKIKEHVKVDVDWSARCAREDISLVL